MAPGFIEARSRIELVNRLQCSGVSNYLTTILPLLVGEGRGEGEFSNADIRPVHGEIR
jgi:hypothetical protein